MRSIISIAFLVFLATGAQSLPQFQSFGQSFSSSSFVGPNGQVVQNSVYEDSNGNRVVNGFPESQQSDPVQAPPPARAPIAATARPVVPQSAAAKPANTDNKSGQYVPDDRGKWKGN